MPSEAPVTTATLPVSRARSLFEDTRDLRHGLEKTAGLEDLPEGDIGTSNDRRLDAGFDEPTFAHVGMCRDAVNDRLRQADLERETCPVDRVAQRG
jgi:hypothetical protein